MSIVKKLKKREIRWHVIAVFGISVLLLGLSIVFQVHGEWFRKSADLCLSSLADFILFGGED